MKKKKKGMTLLEVVIALAIIAIMLLPLASSLLTAVQANKKGDDLQKAKLLAQEIIEKLKIENKIEGDFERDFHNTKLLFQETTRSTPDAQGKIDLSISMQSDDEVNGMEILGEIKGSKLATINDTDYINSQEEHKLGGLLIIKKNEIEYIKPTTVKEDFKSLVAKQNTGTKINVLDSSTISINFNKENSNNELIVKVDKGIERKFELLDGILGVYVQEDNNMNFEFENLRNDTQQNIYVFRDNTLSKEQGELKDRVTYKGMINVVNNIIYDKNNRLEGIYDVKIDVKKDNKIIETTRAQIYIGK